MGLWIHCAEPFLRPPDVFAGALLAQVGRFDVKAPKALMGDTVFLVDGAPRVAVNADR
jgi:hypothetical protein